MNAKSRLAAGAFVLCLAVLGAGTSACGNDTNSATSRTDSSVKVTTIDGYEVKGDPKSAIEYTGNSLIFTGKVVKQEAPRKVNRKTGDSDTLSYIYTPIIVEVDKVWKGSSVRPGEKISVRSIGGQIGSEKTVNKMGPAPDEYKPGMKLVLFTQSFVDAGDGLVAATPNFIYAEDSVGNMYNLHEPTHKTSSAVFMASVSEWTAFNR